MITKMILGVLYLAVRTACTSFRLCSILPENILTQKICWLAPRLFLKYFILPGSIFLDNWEMIRVVVMALKVSNMDVGKILADAGVPLRFVVGWAKLKTVVMMLTKGVKPNDPDHNWGTTALHLVVEKGDRGLEMARMLLNHGANVNAVDQRGYTPLHRTLRLRHPILKMVELLLSRGAKADSLSNDEDITPLLMAVSFNQPLSVVKLLVEYGAKPLEERTLEGGETVLHKASEHQRSDLIDYFLHLGMDVNVGSRSSGRNLLYEVSKVCKPKFFKFLLSRHAKMDYRILRWMLHYPQKIKHAESKLRLFFFYVRLGTTLVSYLLPLIRGFYSDTALPMLEAIALHEFLMSNEELVNQRILERPHESKQYLLECKEELQRMKDEKLRGEVTLINLLTDDFKKVSQYMRNVKMIQALRKTDFKKRYSTYSPYLMYLLEYLKKQYILEKKSEARLVQVQGLNAQHLCARKIVNFLKPQDMRKFLSCF